MHTLFRKTLYVGAMFLASLASAQTYPSKPVTIVVPYPAGGPSDYVARKIQPGVSKALGQPLVIENVGGVGGTLGIQKALNASADGYTIIQGSPIDLIVTPLSLASAKYKSEDLRMVAQIVKGPLVLLARKDFPASNAEELIAQAARPDAKDLAFGNNGQGGLYHLVAAQFSQRAELKATHVPYKGTAQALNDLMGGQIDLLFAVFAGNIPTLVAEGKVKVIGLATRAPLAAFPKLPVLTAHPKLSDFEYSSWAAVMVPRGVPDAVAERLNKVVYETIANPDIRAAFEAMGNTVVAPHPLAELDGIYRSEIERYRTIAKAINLVPQ